MKDSISLIFGEEVSFSIDTTVMPNEVFALFSVITILAKSCSEVNRGKWDVTLNSLHLFEEVDDTA